ncbi:type II toxin-antitoxin system RelE/ParE family toxin [bacterium]|nr:type II toxin-antitoxin system RelE/ParE family toxin [bacterium]MCI0566533.1 type II toxin-antitoxin system RelE/ParE family toxin [bacterium]
MSFSVYIASSARKAVKKLPRNIREEIVQLSREIIARNPYDAEKLQKPLHECRSFHFKLDNIHYRIAYRIAVKEKRIDIVLVGPREGFYERLRRVLK